MALVLFKISLSTPGAILQPQPPPCDRLVRRGMAVVCVELMGGAFLKSPDFASDKGTSTGRVRQVAASSQRRVARMSLYECFFALQWEFTHAIGVHRLLVLVGLLVSQCPRDGVE